MWNFFKDCLNLFLLRFQPSTHYRYHWSTTVGIICLLGVVRYATTYMLLGRGVPVLMFCVLVDLVSWLVLSATMNITLPSFWGAPKISTTYFILVTEALILPVLGIVFLSEDLGSTLMLFIVTWRFWVQLFGLSILSGVSLWKVFISYLLYGLASFMLLMILFTVFMAVGVFDLQEIMFKLQQLQEASGR